MSSASEANFPRGGTSTKSTPANNIGEGSSGLGDSGYPKGSGSVSSHPEYSLCSLLQGCTCTTLTIHTEQATGNFNTLTHQKKPGKEQQEEMRSRSEDPSNLSKEDGDFMSHRPGGSETLPGWNKMKEFAGYGT